jgi:hypothetical protein
MTYDALQWQASAGLIMVVPVVVRMVVRGGSALTGRVGRHSTAGLAVVAAASLASAQLEKGIGRSHPQLRRERRIVGSPVGQQGPRVWSGPGFLTRLCHNATVRRLWSSLQVGPRSAAEATSPRKREALSPRKRRSVVSPEAQKRRLSENKEAMSPRKRRGDVSAETSDAIAADTRPASPPTTPTCPTSPERHCCHCSSHCARPQAASARPRHRGRRELKRHRWPIVVALTTSMAHRCCLPGTHETRGMMMAGRMRLTGAVDIGRTARALPHCSRNR